MNYQIEVYIHNGRSAFTEWFDELDATTAARVDRHIRRMEAANLGSVKTLTGGLSELRLNFGPGYRVYFGIQGLSLIILLGGGDKKRQSVDIANAREHWKHFLRSR